MSVLSPCPACHRHVRQADPVCPFCSAALPPPSNALAPPQPRARLSRAAIFTAGAVLIGLTSCSNTSNNPSTDGAPPAGSGGSSGSGGAAGATAGAGGHAGAAGAGGAAGTAGHDAGLDGPIAIYSAAFPPTLTNS
jgi:hypothetical protein